MKVARIHAHGGPEALVYEDAPDPVIQPDQILLRVRASALNHLDLFVRAGIPGQKIPMPHILGSDIAGEVVAVGELCRRVKPGWRVLLAPGVSCRQCEECVSGRDNFCRAYTLFGLGVDGGNYRVGLLQVPTSGFELRFIEFSGVDKKTVQGRVQDPGSTRMQLRVRDIDAAIAVFKRFGGEVVSTGGKPLDLPAGNNKLKVAIVRDPNNLFVVLIESPPAG
jgi:hypothetical protein